MAGYRSGLSLTVIGTALVIACHSGSALVPVTFTGVVQDERHQPVGDAFVSLRHSPGDSGSRWVEFSSETDSAGRFVLNARLPRGCYGVLIGTFWTDAVDWHVRVEQPSVHDIGTVTLTSSAFPGEGWGHLVLQCGAIDTLKPRGGWDFDTLRVDTQ